MSIQMIKPVITEKSMKNVTNGWYTFRVDRNASKPQIAGQISQRFDVTVIAVRTMVIHGKIRRVGKKMRQIKRPDWKKVQVRLKSGQSIAAFQISGEEKTEK
ncbi:50S ribosomal protein L23 [Candidatus Gottesmanbacteria bacterium RBG_16_43_7]|uniref:Large ribosomal subunit protein uL23 n=1 Tax=Candidatus Gottesmanbacteria bacterium RBG_16_43_7 TaxID=1798373 RepID=A0A1F5ZAD3_9BACT|nr:MAG: 50S ribosomal protein L23 [Candidatus Gottesmanbacteria bacterium RBG_16_43_7]